MGWLLVDVLARSRPAASLWHWLRGKVQMTTYLAAFLLAWAVGYVLGFKLKMIRSALYAS